MKRITLTLLSFLVFVAFSPAQDVEQLYRNKFSYDLKQNRLNVKFDGKLFWLKISSLNNDSLTLTYLMEGDTPTTAKEFITFILLPMNETVDGYLEKLIESTRRYMPGPPDITNFSDFQGGEQKILSSLLEDSSNNLLEDDIIRLTKLKGQRLRVMVHTKRLKLSEVQDNPDLAVTEIGDKRSRWMQEILRVTYPF